MVGKDCVAIACDLRLGMQALTVSNNFPKIYQYGDVYLGLTGLGTDLATVSDLFRYKVNMYRLREERNISPQTMANLVSSHCMSGDSVHTLSARLLQALTRQLGSHLYADSIVLGALILQRTLLSAGQQVTSCLGHAKVSGNRTW